MNKPLHFPAISRDWRDPASPDIVNIAIRCDDQQAFAGIIRAREKLIETKIDRFVARDQGAARLTEETANCALDAFIEMKRATPDRALVKARLELTAAMAIAALRELEGKA